MGKTFLKNVILFTKEILENILLCYTILAFVFFYQ